jgi:DNA-binding transcriptional ArsR family regulator
VVPPDDPAAAAPVFAALGDETRLGIVTRLSAEGPLSIARLTAGRGVTRQAVTKHLHVLAQAGLAHSSQMGRERIWELEPRPLLTARECLSRISLQWDEALARLQRFVEEVEDDDEDVSSAPKPAPPDGRPGSRRTRRG